MFISHLYNMCIYILHYALYLNMMFITSYNLDYENSCICVVLNYILYSYRPYIYMHCDNHSTINEHNFVVVGCDYNTELRL